MPSRLRAALAGRIPGLDLARAVAIIGMVGAHVGDRGTRGPDSDGWPWLWVTEGRSAALFAVLAGVTISLMVRRSESPPGHTVVRIAVRGSILIALGYALDLLGTPIDIVLTNLGLMFFMVLPFLRWPRTALVLLAALAIGAGTTVARAAEGGLDGWPVIEKLVSTHYPAVAWVGYVLIGMAVGRAPLARGATAGWLLIIGTFVTVVGYGEGLLLGSPTPWSLMAGDTWASVTPHSNTIWEMTGNIGLALVIIGVCLALAAPSRLAAPFLAFGSMSLTMYTAHVLVIWWVGDAMVYRPSNVAFVVLTLGLVAVSAVWRTWLGPGPLERALTRGSSWCANALIKPAA